MLKVRDQEIPYSITSADDVDRLEAARATYQKAQSGMAALTGGAAIRRACNLTGAFIDRAFGAGTCARFGVSGTDFADYLSLLTDLNTAVENAIAQRTTAIRK